LTIARVLLYLYTGTYSIGVDYTQFKISMADTTEDRQIVLSTSSAPETVSTTNNDVAEIISKLKAHTLVYRAADRFDIPDLKLHAYYRFTQNFDSSAHSDKKLSELATLVSESTTPQDDLLRLDFSSACIREFSITSKNDSFVKIMRQYEPVAWALGTKLAAQIENKNEAISRERDTSRKLRQDLRVANQSNESLESKVAMLEAAAKNSGVSSHPALIDHEVLISGRYIPPIMRRRVPQAP
jgi:hypothetical protein